MDGIITPTIQERKNKMSNVWFSSDLHAGHQRDFLYVPRGFSSIEEHDEAIIDNINEVVAPEDTLYLLGDLMLGDNEEGARKLRQIQCKDIRVIRGNHDTDTRVRLYEYSLGYQMLGYAAPAKFNGKNFMLSHYPMATTNFDFEKKPWERVYNLCGHSHTKEKWDPATDSIHVELDAWNNYPVNIEDVYKLIRERYGFQ